MKKTLLLVTVISLFASLSFAQNILSFPSSSNKIFTINVDSKVWDAQISDGILSISPKKSQHSNSFVCMMWASDNPTAETAVSDLTEQAATLIKTILSDVTFGDDITDFENNGIAFYGTDGSGYYEDNSGNKTKMFTSIILMLPKNQNEIVALVFFATPEVYKIYEQDFVNLVLAIK